jgi:hypothetical protein
MSFLARWISRSDSSISTAGAVRRPAPPSEKAKYRSQILNGNLNFCLAANESNVLDQEAEMNAAQVKGNWQQLGGKAEGEK